MLLKMDFYNFPHLNFKKGGFYWKRGRGRPGVQGKGGPAFSPRPPGETGGGPRGPVPRTKPGPAAAPNWAGGAPGGAGPKGRRSRPGGRGPNRGGAPPRGEGGEKGTGPATRLKRRRNGSGGRRRRFPRGRTTGVRGPGGAGVFHNPGRGGGDPEAGEKSGRRGKPGGAQKGEREGTAEKTARGEGRGGNGRGFLGNENRGGGENAPRGESPGPAQSPQRRDSNQQPGGEKRGKRETRRESRECFF